MSYRVELLETKIGRLGPDDYAAELNAFAKDGYRFVQAIPLDMNRAILIFEKLPDMGPAPKFGYLYADNILPLNCDGIQWLEDITITE